MGTSIWITDANKNLYAIDGSDSIQVGSFPNYPQGIAIEDAIKLLEEFAKNGDEDGRYGMLINLCHRIKSGYVISSS